MPRGPLPDPNAQRRNAATIPTTELPLAGRTEPAPDIPDWRPLGPAGRRYWSWAWSTSEAAAWGTGAVDAVARRASLEDDLAAIELPGNVSISELIGQDIADDDLEDQIDQAFKSLSRLAGGKLRIIAEMGKLDIELGLTPKSRAQLRWRVVGTPTPVAANTENAGDKQSASSGSRTRLTVVG